MLINAVTASRWTRSSSTISTLRLSSIRMPVVGSGVAGKDSSIGAGGAWAPGVRCGRYRVKLLPPPTSLRTVISPSSRRASSRLMDRPSPVPPYFLAVLPSACWKASKISCSLSAGMPTPVSVTENASTASARERPG